MKIDFYALDVETANSSFNSICQVGIAGYHNESVVFEYTTLVNPQGCFHYCNTAIHGLTADVVQYSPAFHEIYTNLRLTLQNNLVVSHTRFDRVALDGVCNKYKLPHISCLWLDSSRVARRAWRQFARRGYNLSNICKFLGYEFKHHDALEDAKAAGNIIISACRQEGIQPKDLLGYVSGNTRRPPR